MKNQLYYHLSLSLSLSLSLCLSFMSCDYGTDSDYAGDNLIKYSVAQSENYTNEGTGLNVNSLRSDSCIEFTTTQWLYGSGEERTVLQSAKLEEGMFESSSKHFFITAKGDAMSSLYARGISNLDLIISTQPYRIQGTLTTEFYFGEEVDLMLDGEVDVRYEGQNLYLTSIVKEAKLRSGTEEMELTYGEVVFVLPVLLAGDIQLDITTYSMFCKL